MVVTDVVVTLLLCAYDTPTGKIKALAKNITIIDIPFIFNMDTFSDYYLSLKKRSTPPEL